MTVTWICTWTLTALPLLVAKLLPIVHQPRLRAENSFTSAGSFEPSTVTGSGLACSRKSERVIGQTVAVAATCGLLAGESWKGIFGPKCPKVYVHYPKSRVESSNRPKN